ncbi:MAG: DNA repair protein RadA, partial [Neisseriaceae bacterium]|nr:DNA repair protein RadA [Neisseriaceae bacterium]
MAKIKTQYSCTECGGVSPKWQGKCPHCGQWNTLTEETAVSSDNTAARFRSWTGQTASIQELSSVAAEETPLMPCGSAELDRVLGGGLVAGAMILLGGDPGIGKSTLLLQILSQLAATQKVLY